MSSLSSRDTYYYAALQQEHRPLRSWFAKLRLLTGPQICAAVIPVALVLAGGVLAANLIASPQRQVGWLETGDRDLRVFSLEPSETQIVREDRTVRLQLNDQSLFVKYRQRSSQEQVQLRTPHVTIVARDAVFFTETGPADTIVGVQRGELVLFTADETATFAGPGEQLIISAGPPRRVPGTHRHFEFLELVFPRPDGDVHALVAATEATPTPPPAPSQTIAEPNPAAATVVARTMIENRQPRSKRRAITKRAQRTRTTRLPRKAERRNAPISALPVVEPATAHDEELAWFDDDLGAPVIVALEEAGHIDSIVEPAPSTEHTEPQVAPQPDESRAVFEAPSGWWD